MRNGSAPSTWRSNTSSIIATIAFGREARGVDFADALDPVVGHELQEQEVAPAEGGRRIADDEGLELGDFHRRLEALRAGTHLPSGSL